MRSTVRIALGALAAGAAACGPLAFWQQEQPYAITRLDRSAPAPTPVAAEPTPAPSTARASSEAPTEVAERTPAVTAKPAPASVDVAAPVEEQPPKRSTELAEAPTPEAREATEAPKEPTAAAKTRPEPKLVRSDRVIGAPIAEGDWTGVVEDILLDTASGSVFGLVAASKADRRVYSFSALSWQLQDGGWSIAVAAPKEGERARLFDGRETQRITGVVTGIDAVEASASGAAALRLRDSDNRHHRVLIPASELVRRAWPALDVGAEVWAEGPLTRDAAGKLLVAGTIGVGGETVRLRDAKGAVRWADLIPSAEGKAAIPASLRTADENDVDIRAWVLDLSTASAAWLCIDVEGTTRLLPWGEVQRHGTWSVTAKIERLAALRAAPSGRR